MAFVAKTCSGQREDKPMIRSLITGLAGAGALTIAHSIVRKSMPDAPRMDLFGLDTVRNIFNRAGINANIPAAEGFFSNPIVGDLVSNTLYFSGVGSRRGIGAWIRGAMLGVSAGLGIVGLSPKSKFESKSAGACANWGNCATTIGIYTLGGLAAAAMANLIGHDK
jgi:hypothetical protein